MFSLDTSRWRYSSSGYTSFHILLSTMSSANCSSGSDIKCEHESLPLLVITTTKPHRLLGLALVAMSAFMFSVMSTCIKLESYSITSMEIVFWRAGVAWLLNLVGEEINASRLQHLSNKNVNRIIV